MLDQQSIALASEFENAIIAWRRDFHKHPELGFAEVRTAAIVEEELRRLGFDVQTNVGKTGVVGRLRTGDGGRVVAIRADMDALPILEANEEGYTSENDGIMHACGHDAHTAILLGVARMITAMPDRPAGEFRLLFQPCEETTDAEGKSGGLRMVEEGAMDGVDHVIALHVDSTMTSGVIEIRDGYITASADEFALRVIGRGVHAAHPDKGIDPIYLSAQVLNAIYAIPSRYIDPIQPALITIGAIHGGTAENIIPGEVVIRGTIRAYGAETRDALAKALENAASITRALGGDYELTLRRGCPSTYNDPAVTRLIETTAADLFGADQVISRPPSMGGEDFSYMTDKAPGAMFMLGAKKDTVDRQHHHPLFDLNESSFARGAALLFETALRLMTR